MAAWSLASWVWEPGVLLALGALVGSYVVGLRRFRPRTLWDEHIVSTRELVCFASCVFLLLVALVSPLDSLSNLMFSAHMVQHMLLIYFAPPLLLLGTPAWLIRPFLEVRQIRAVWKFVTNPVIATVIFNLTLVVWHMPGPWDYALVDPQIHALEHLTMFASGIIVWWPVYSPSPELPRLSYPPQMLFIFVQSLVPAIIGAFMTFSGRVIYPVYLETPKQWGLSPLADQQIAGLLMKVLGTLYLWILLTIRFFQWFNHEEHLAEKEAEDADLARRDASTHSHIQE
jgi:putative membrane protein